MDANPLENIGVLQDAGNIALVMRGGRVMKNVMRD